MPAILAILSLALGVIALGLGLSFLLSYPIMLLWNGCLVGAISGVSEVTWLQAWGLTVLFGWLFKDTSIKK